MHRHEVAMLSTSGRRLLRQLATLTTGGLRSDDFRKTLRPAPPSAAASMFICGFLFGGLLCCSALAQSPAGPQENPSDPVVKDPKLFDPRRSLEGTLKGRVADEFT